MVVAIGICDDDQNVCEFLADACERYSRKHGFECRSVSFSSGEELLRYARSSEPLDLLFLDIVMEGASGMDVARKLREGTTWRDTRIVFVTSMVHYAVEGYRVHAFGFLTKPFTLAELERVLNDAMRSLAIDQEKRIALKTDGGICFIDANKILYVEAFAHRMKVVQAASVSACFSSMNKMEEGLKARGFFRCHRSYLVNLREVERIEGGECEMSNGDIVPISRHRSRDFLDAFSRFIGAWL